MSWKQRSDLWRLLQEFCLWARRQLEKWKLWVHYISNLSIRSTLQIAFFTKGLKATQLSDATGFERLGLSYYVGLGIIILVSITITVFRGTQGTKIPLGPNIPCQLSEQNWWHDRLVFSHPQWCPPSGKSSIYHCYNVFSLWLFCSSIAFHSLLQPEEKQLTLVAMWTKEPERFRTMLIHSRV